MGNSLGISAGKSLGRVLGFVLVGAATVIPYQNCGEIPQEGPSSQFLLFQPPLGGQSGSHLLPPSRSTLLAQLKATNAPQDEEFCSDGKNYQCTHRIYAPGLKYGHIKELTCSPEGDFCYWLETLTYDSSEALAACRDCGADDGEPGGRYHYSEFSCFHQKISEQTGYMVGRDSSSVESALLEVRASCDDLLAAPQNLPETRNTDSK